VTRPLQLTESALAHYLPWWWAGDGVLVNHDGSLCIGYAIEGIDVSCQPDEQVNQVARNLRDLLNALPVGTTLQFLVRAHTVDAAAFRSFIGLCSSRDPILQEQRKRAADHLQKLGLRRFDNYMLLIKPRALGALGSHFSGGLTRLIDKVFSRRDPYSITQEQHDRAVTELGQAGDTIIRYLKATGARASRLNDQQLVGLAYAILNPSRAAHGVPPLVDGLPPELPEDQRPLYRALSLREQLVHSSLTWDVDQLYLDDPVRVHRVMGLKALPPRTVASLIRSAIKVPFDHWLSITVSVPDSESKFGEVERRRNRAQASAAGYVRNVKASVQAAELEQVLEAMVARDQRVFQTSLHLLFGANSLAELDHRTREVIDVFRNMNSTVVQTESYGQLPAFIGMLPGAGHQAPHKRTLLTDNAADLLPIYRTWAGDPRPLFMVQTRSSEPFAIDITDPSRTNWNSCVFGQSGGGKTFLVLSLATSSMLGQGSPLIVIDVGGGAVGSYYRLVQMLGGDFIDLSLDGANCINPFFPRQDLYLSDRGEPTATANEFKLAFLTGIVGMLVTEPGMPPLTTVQEAILQRAILAAYDRLGDDRPPVLGDVIADLEHLTLEREEKADARAFAKTLRAWVEGPYGRLLNQQSRVSIKSDFVVFDVKGIESIGRLASVLISIVSAYVWNMISRPRSGLGWIVYDECWKLLQNPTAAALISELYRTARKLRAGVISVTQKLEDFLSSPASEAILSNSTTTFLLRHKDGHDPVAERVGLNERECALFKSLTTEKGRFAEFFYKSENGSAVLRNAPSPFDYWVNTTDPRDRDLEARILSDVGGDRLAALRRLTREYPNGAAARRS
jgi:conjugal transfer ATP-binding protein TraC